MVQLKYLYDKDFMVVAGSNGSGKTTFVDKFLLGKVPKDKIFVLNSSRQRTWANRLPSDHIYNPVMFTKKFFEKFLLEFVSKHSNCVLVLDDVDNYIPKDSAVLNSIIINARHMGIGLIVTVRRLSSLPIELYGQARYIFVSRQNVMYDIYYIENTIPREFATQFLGLPKYVFGCYDAEENKLSKVQLKI